MKGFGCADIKDILKKEKEAKEKELKANKGKPLPGAAAPIVTFDLKLVAKESQDAKKKEREALVKEAEAMVADAQYNAGFWYEAAVPQCPRNVRCCGKTGSDMLSVSLIGFDPPGSKNAASDKRCSRWRGARGTRSGGVST